MKTGTGQTLREREAEVERINAAIASVRGGQAQLLVVEGPAGTGKRPRFPFGMVHELLEDCAAKQ